MTYSAATVFMGGKKGHVTMAPVCTSVNFFGKEYTKQASMFVSGDTTVGIRKGTRFQGFLVP